MSPSSVSVFCFNGAMTSQPWIRHHRRMPPNRLSRFNGAMTSQPWIPCAYFSCASEMRMLQWSHDLSAMDTRPTSSCSPSIELLLQWSHDLSAMDTARCRPLLRRSSHGFNGAMTSQPWIRRRRSRRDSPARSLQWSHDLSAMDTVFDADNAQVVIPLQWSHDLSAMDTRRPCPQQPVRQPGFNGAMTSQPWIPDAIRYVGR